MVGLEELLRLGAFFACVFATVGVLAVTLVYPKKRLSARRRREAFAALGAFAREGWEGPAPSKESPWTAEWRLRWKRAGVVAAFAVPEPARPADAMACEMRLRYAQEAFHAPRARLALRHPGLLDLFPAAPPSAWKDLEPLEFHGALEIEANGPLLILRLTGEAFGPELLREFALRGLRFAEHTLREVPS